MIIKLLRHILLSCFILFLSNKPINSQDRLITNYKVSKLSGIPQNTINAIFKDSKGFMWICTLDGLVRFDGYNTKTYRIKPGQNSISSNMIIDIAEDNLGNLWIATFGKGLCKLNPINETFTAYQQKNKDGYRIKSDDISSLLVDGNNIWIGNLIGASRIKFDRSMSIIKEEEIISIADLSPFPGIQKVRKRIKGQNNEIWLGLNTHLLKLVNPYASLPNIKIIKQKGNATTLCYFDSTLIVAGEFIAQVNELPQDSFNLRTLRYSSATEMLSLNNTLWVGNRKGITGFKKRNDYYWDIATHFSTQSGSNSLSNNMVLCIEKDELNRIWLGTNGGGVNILSPIKEPFKHYKSSDKPQSLSNNDIRTVFEDSEQNLWIGTEEGGLNYIINNEKYNYTDGFKHLSIENYPTEFNRVYAINEQITPKSKKQKSLIWLGTSFPTFLMAINPETMEEVQQPEFVKKLGFVFAIEVQNDSTLWVGTYGGGLWKLITNSDGRITNKYHYTPDDKVDHPISSYIIRNILHDSKGNIWITTDKGLNRIVANETNLSVPNFKAYKQGQKNGQLSHDYVVPIFESSTSKIWLGSMGGGLIGIEEEINSDSILFSTLTTKDGLPNNSIKGILEDKTGNLWLSSNHGLTKYNPVTGDIVNYDIEDGLQSNEFAEIVACSRKNGELIFGGNNGFNVFNPEHVSIDSVKPKLFFTDFHIFNERIEPGIPFDGKIVLKNSIEYTKSIILKHNQNSFSVGFAGLQFNSPQKNKYKYTLDGFDEKWYPTTAEYRIAKYTNIPTGEYTLKIIAANSDNIWTDHPISLDIRIKPHPMASTIAYGVYFIFFILLLLIIVQIIRNISKRKKALLIAEIEKQNAEEVAQTKLRFFTNISHEFRTPLTLILLPLERMLKSTNTKSIADTKNLNLIKRNADLMLRLINQILDFRKLEQGKIKLNLIQINIVAFTHDIFKNFEPLAEEKEIQFIFKSNSNTLFATVDPAKLEKVVYNLLSNAIKFTPKNGTVTLELTDIPPQNKIHLTVSDTGIGICESDQSLVFNRYYQSSNNSTGTGIGLSLSKGLVELHNGTIKIKSQEGKGTSFTVSLPKIIDENSTEELEDEKLVAEHPKNTTNKQLTIESDLKSTPITKTAYKVLIVEDNDNLREELAISLDQHFKVYQAENGLAGIEACINFGPDLVVSDIMMPIMDGVELLLKIKNDERVSHIPVLLLTAKTTVEEQIKGFRSGADAYIPKPFTIDFLVANIISLLKNRENLRLKFQKEIEITPLLISNSPADVQFMEKILKIIEESLSESEFSVEKLASEYGISQIQLIRKIKALAGETPAVFIRNIRLKHAAELLKQNTLTISEVTGKVGYTDLGAFRKRFKAMFGVSPSDFAKKWKEDA